MTKKYFCFLLLSFILLHAGTNAFAQKPKHKGKQPSEQISWVVEDLSAKQKRQIEEISKEHSARLATLKKQLSAVRDSIHVYMDKQADCSTIVFPLMERESSLQLQFNKEMYKMKLRLDKILTKEQYNTLLNHQHSNGMHRGHNPMKHHSEKSK